MHAARILHYHLRGLGKRAIKRSGCPDFRWTHTQYTASDITCNWTVNLSIPKCKHCPNAIDQSKLSIEVANRLHRRDCSALTQYAPLHPSRLTGIISPGSGQYNRDQTYRSRRRTGFELVETRLHTSLKSTTTTYTITHYTRPFSKKLYGRYNI